MPSWSVSGKTYRVRLDHETRILDCECPAFVGRRDCHHVRGLAWFTCKPRRRRGVQPTSIMSFHALYDSLGEKQRAVLSLFNGHPLSDRQASRLLGWPINRVTPRRHELMKMGMVAPAGIAWDEETKRNVMLWRKEG